jgi:hypothetical protein|tara:strand:- start:360 stop:584 length:225 start_codon:yes stop_codon:yes gene_type:complete
MTTINKGLKMTIKSIAQETGTINIVPTWENLLITYARLYSRMDIKGQKKIDQELSKVGKYLDKQNTNLNISQIK